MVNLLSIGKAVLVFSIFYSIVCILFSALFLANGFPPPAIFGNLPSINYFFLTLSQQVSSYGYIPQSLMGLVVAYTIISILLSFPFSVAGLLSGLVSMLVAPAGLSPALVWVAYIFGIFLDMTKFYYLLMRATGSVGGPIF